MTLFQATSVPTQTFLRALTANIKRSRESSTHLRETDEFLFALSEHLSWYDRLLHRLSSDPVVQRDHLYAAIQIIGGTLYDLTEDVKGLCEGTTDRIPFALATLLHHELKQQTPFFLSTQDSSDVPDQDTFEPEERINIALCPISESNYWYYDISEAIKGAFDRLSSRLHFLLGDYMDLPELRKPPAVPASLIQIGFQYAMVDDILFNVSLYHELGHHVFNSRVVHQHQSGSGQRRTFREDYNDRIHTFLHTWLRDHDDH